ncbi:GNAT family N-acetyltransferase [Mycolicibacterium litorale]|nr:GNAT family N-acetyltransferase [Mycolicibacterium litorale]
MRTAARCDSVESVVAPEDVMLRSAGDDDWPAMRRLAATCFGSFRDPDTLAAWRSMTRPDSVVLACDGDDVVGMAMVLDLELTVPGGRLLPMAGITWVAVAPTHRRRGLLRAMFTELHRRIIDAGYPIAGLLASEATIYERFGYGPATVETTLRVDRRAAHLHPDVPRADGVRVVDPVEHRDALADVYERWRRRTPGGLHTPTALWDDVLADRESARRGGSQHFALLHPDGFVMYRTHVAGTGKSVEVTKFTAVTAQAHLALWQTLLGLDLMETITVDTHPADPLPYLLVDPRRIEKVADEDALWLRIVDIPKVLEARTYASDVDTVLEVVDGVLGGGGRYRLTVRDGRAHCVPSTADPDVRLSLSVLGSIYLGAHRPSAFATAHRLICEDPSAPSALDLAFSSDVPAELGYGF